MEEPIQSFRYWIFQAEPKRFDLTRYLERGEPLVWDVTRYAADMARDDIVYYWQSGSRAGIYGWGRITGDIQEKNTKAASKTLTEITDDPDTPHIQVTCQNVFADAPILHEKLSQDESFGNLTIMRNQQGTNFRVTYPEAMALNRIIADTGVQPPDDPYRDTQTSHISAAALRDFRYSGTTRQVLNLALQAAQKREGPTLIDPPLIMTAGLQMAVWSDPSRNDCATFLLEQMHQVASPNPDQLLEAAWLALGISPHSDFGPKDRTQPKSKIIPTVTACLISDDALTLLTEMRALAVAVTGHERIKMRHCAGTLIAPQASAQWRTSVQAVLTKYGLDQSSLLEDFLKFVAERYPDDNQDRWQATLKGQAGGTSGAATMAQLLARVDADNPTGEDWLDITNEVNAFATMIAAEKVQPPLAIGLFGDWGSGKTFFMNKVHDRVEAIALHPASGADEDPFCHHTVQIRFNAWHYVEGNLWASLVDHIFQSMRQKLDQEEAFETLIRTLGISEEDRQAADSALEKAQDRLKEANEKKGRLTKQKESKEEEVNDKIQGELLSGDDLQEDYRAIAGLLPDVEKDLGTDFFPTLPKSEEVTLPDLVRVLGEAGLVASRTQNLWRALINAKIPQATRRRFAWTSLAIFILGVAFIFVFNADFFGAAAAVAAQISAAVGYGVKWAQPKLKAATRLLDKLEHAQRQLQRKSREAAHRRSEEIAQLNTELDRLSREIIAAEKEVQDAKSQSDKLADPREQSTPELLSRFVSQRAECEDYRQYLGVPALVRKDFEMLSALMKKQRQETSRDDSLPRIDRIVLYIDDLDRCPPGRVVDVLQAIHLLLAFPLFVVVVGVDSRWVSRSLYRHYRSLLRMQEKKTSDPLQDPVTATTHDYLEKIFQIPFWLRPIEADRAGSIISGVTNGDQAAPQESSGETSRDETGDTSGENHQEAQDDPEVDVGESEDEEKDVSGQTHLPVKALLLDHREVAYMKLMGGVVGRTPRAVKRYVNSYRLLKASHPNTQSEAFLTGERKEYRTPLLLLAVQVGRPRLAGAFYRMLETAKGMGFEEFCGEKLATQNEEAWHVLTRQFDNAFAAEKSMEEPPGFPDVDDLLQWHRRVARYGYQEWRYSAP